MILKTHGCYGYSPVSERAHYAWREYGLRVGI